MIISKTSGEKQVLDSSSIILFDTTSTVNFNIQCDDTFSFELIFKFMNDNSKKQELKIEASENIITLLCLNFNNVLGTGTKQALEIATFEGRKIYINFWVTALGKDSLKRLDYTIYREAEV